jgi:hypothetical protein
MIPDPSDARFQLFQSPFASSLAEKVDYLYAVGGSPSFRSVNRIKIRARWRYRRHPPRNAEPSRSSTSRSRIGANSSRAPVAIHRRRGMPPSPRTSQTPCGPCSTAGGVRPRQGARCPDVSGAERNRPRPAVRPPPSACRNTVGHPPEGAFESPPRSAAAPPELHSPVSPPRAHGARQPPTWLQRPRYEIPNF